MNRGYSSCVTPIEFHVKVIFCKVKILAVTGVL
jgi:hypothetical protein